MRRRGNSLFNFLLTCELKVRKWEGTHTKKTERRDLEGMKPGREKDIGKEEEETIHLRSNFGPSFFACVCVCMTVGSSGIK